jgi:hypothetical protein
MMSEFYSTGGRRTTRRAGELRFPTRGAPRDTGPLRCFERPVNPFDVATLARYM